MAALGSQMETAALCAWGGVAVQIISAGAMHKWPKQQWIGSLLLIVGWLVFVAAFSVWYSDRHDISFWWLAVGGAGLPIAALRVRGATTAELHFSRLLESYQFCWPLERPSIYVGMIVPSFARLGGDGTFEIGIMGINASSRTLWIQGVDGLVTYFSAPDAEAIYLANPLPGITKISLPPKREFVFALFLEMARKPALALSGMTLDDPPRSFDFRQLNIWISSRPAGGRRFRMPIWDGIGFHGHPQHMQVGRVINASWHDSIGARDDVSV